jgi:DNA (cytosine-5)-methyltransferase 1
MIRVGTDCSGIEAPIMALQTLKVPHDHLFSSEVDADCCTVIKKNYKPKKIYHDMLKRDHRKLPLLDVYIAGFPCQAFSGLRNDAKGFQDPRGTIFFECLKTIAATKPKIFVFENVRGLVSHDGGNTFRTILHSLAQLKKYNIYHKMLNTRDYGVPQNRPRIYIVGILKKLDPQHKFSFPAPIPLRKTVSDVMRKSGRLPEDTSKLTPNMVAVIRNRLERQGQHGRNEQTNYIINVGASVDGFGSAMKEVCPCLMANAHRYYSTRFKRFLTGREYLRLQDFPESFKTHENDRVTKKQAGNSMSVNVLRALFLRLLPFLSSSSSLT